MQNDMITQSGKKNDPACVVMAKVVSNFEYRKY